MRLYVQICLAALLITLAVPATHGQKATAQESYPQVELEGTQTRTLTSSIVEDQTYKLYVNLPRSYWNEETRSTYPVLYVLDGQWDFSLAQSIYGSQFYDGFLPEMIIVGITWGGENPNVDSLRARDFTPTRIDQMPHTGGAEAFLSAIKNEIVPFVEAEYPARADGRALMGSSFGGLFTLYAMFHETALFNRYVVSAPSLQWDNEMTHRYEEEFAARNTELPARVFMIIGEYENVDAFEQFASTLRERGHDGLDLETHVVAGTGHSGHKAEGYTRGMQYVFKRPSLALPAEVLDAYVGTYQLGEQLRVDIWRDGHYLVGRQNGQDEDRLHAESDEDFYIEGAHVFIRFVKENDEVTGFHVRTFNDELFLQRVES